MSAPLVVPQLLSVARAAEALDCSRAHVYRLISAGALRSVEIHEPTSARSKTRVLAEDLAAYVAAQTSHAS